MRTLLLTALAAALTAGLAAPVSAAPPAPAMTTMTARTTQKATSTRAPAKPRTVASIDCSKQADAKNLHGKDREKFRKSCMKSGK